MKSLLVFCLFALSSSLFAAPPNIILINIDDLGYADIGPFGSKNATPHLDRMAKEGMKLTSHYAAPVCSPSRSAMMTGCYPKRVLPIPGVLFPASAVGLNPDEITVAEVFKDAGYATACIGKWHLGDQPEFLPTAQGFDSYLGIPYSNDMGLASEGSKSNPGQPLPQGNAKAKAGKNAKGDADPETGLKGNTQPPLPMLDGDNVVERVKAAEQHTFTRYTERAVKFIREHQKKPFFLYLPHNAVHFPLYPQRIHGQVRHGPARRLGARGGLVRRPGARHRARAQARLEHARHLHQRQRRPAQPRRHNTPHCAAAKAARWKAASASAPSPGGPAKIAPAPKPTPSPRTWTGCPLSPRSRRRQNTGGSQIDGIDLSPLLLGQTGSFKARDVFYYYRGFNLEAVRSGPWKLHLGKNELYNLDSDIGEATNVAAETRRSLSRSLKALPKAMKDDLGLDGTNAPGVRPLGRVEESPAPHRPRRQGPPRLRRRRQDAALSKTSYESYGLWDRHHAHSTSFITHNPSLLTPLSP
jgi:arylsulfatase A